MQPQALTPRHGGARLGAGRKPASHVPTPIAADFDAARARNEAAKAGLNEHKLQVERGDYIPRDAVRQASSTALSVLTQALRSLPDTLERTLSLDPEVVEAIAVQIDATLTDCARAFEAMSGDPLTK